MSYELRVGSKEQEARSKKNFVSYILPLVSCLLPLFIACQKTSEPPPVEKKVKIVAIVNGEKITADEFEREFSVLRKKDGPDEIAEMEQAHPLRKNLLNQLIEKKLLLQEAKKLNISATDAELEEAVRQAEADYPQDTMKEAMRNEGITRGEWKTKIGENILVERLVTEQLKGKVNVSDNDIGLYFKKNFKDFVKPLQVRAFQIVVKSEEEAINIRSDLLRGWSFGDIAREKSIGPEAEKGGDLGFFSEGEMPQEFDIIFKLKAGEISHPVKTPYGYHIFKLIERREAKKMDISEAREKIRRILIKEKYDDALNNLITSLKSSASIEIKETL
jgi:parvulin-like peptidyl-prolyl isomerase